MPRPSIIAIGASAGGVTALRRLTAGLTHPLPVPILIVLHIGAHASELPLLLNSAGVTPAKHAEDGEPIRPGRIYVAPPDRHMVVADGHLHLTRGPKENWTRPAIDPLFRSAAEAYGPGAIGVILTGRLNDGTTGLYDIKCRGGIAIAQDPDDAAHPDMPGSAVTHVEIDYRVPLADIPSLLTRLVTEPIGSVTSPSLSLQKGLDMTNGDELQRPAALTCPDCGGALRRSEIGTIVRYACHIGHAYTAEAMAAAQFDEVEKTLRAAERILNERAEFCLQMAEWAETTGCDAVPWRTANREALDRAVRLRGLVEQDWSLPDMVRRPDAIASGPG